MPTASSTSALTLAEYAKISKKPEAKAFCKSIWATPSVLKYMRLRTNTSLTVNAPRITNSGLPTVAWSRINKQASDTGATFDTVAGSMFLIANIIPIDTRVMRDPNQMVNPITAQFEAYTESLNIEVTRRFFKNDPTDTTNGNVDAWPGLRYIFGSTALMTEHGLNTAMTLDGGGVQINPANGSGSTASRLTNLIQQCLNKMGKPEGDGVVIFLDHVTLGNYLQFIKISNGLFTQTTDAYDRDLFKYKRATFAPMMWESDLTTEIIATNENVSGALGSGTQKYSSLWFVDMDPARSLAWQPQVLSPFELPRNGVERQFLVDWGCGFMGLSDRWACRLFDVQVRD
jgi:hypothetical protein